VAKKRHWLQIDKKSAFERPCQWIVKEISIFSLFLLKAK